MGNILRNMKRQMKPHYTCCGKKMSLKEGYGYICEVCGKVKKPKRQVI